MQPTPSSTMLHVPDGYVLRPARLDDAEAVAQLINGYNAEVGIQAAYTAELIRSEWETPTHDFANNSCVITTTDGQIVVGMNLWQFSNPPVRTWLNFYVTLEHRHKGLEAVVFEWALARAQALIAKCPPDTKVVIQTSINIKNIYQNTLFQEKGWQVVRHFYRMRVDLTELPPAPTWPDGYHVRPYQHPEEVRDMLSVDIEAFRDHWGFVDTPIDEEIADSLHYWNSLPYFEPNLFFNVIDERSNSMAATIWNLMEEEGKPDVAYVETVAVLREHRGKGIAEAMLRHSFHELYQRGRKSITLYVDADSLTGALRLYEKVGMHVDQTTARYEIVLREGTDLMTRELEG